MNYNKKFLKYTIVFGILILCSLFSIKNILIKKSNSNGQKHLSEKYNHFKSSLINKKLLSIKMIITNIHIDKNIYLLVYNGFDCQLCIDKGYKIIKNISSNSLGKFYIIASNTNISSDQIRNEYYDTIYHDKKERIRTEIKFIPTPILLRINEEYKILDAFFLLNIDQETDMKKFLSRNSY